MPYNITRWKTKRLENLRIPLASFYKHERKDWHPDRENNDDGTVTLGGLESTAITGALQDGILSVKSIECEGEGSGTFMNWILKPALGDSTGELIANLVWEGGDTINSLAVKDGTVTLTDLDV